MTEREGNTNKDFMGVSFGDNKMDKTQELNESMTITDSSSDAYENKIKGLGGNE